MVKKTFFTSFFLLILISSSVTVSAINADFSTETPSITLSANSELPIEGTYIADKIPGKVPERCRILIKNPVNERVYMIDSKTDYWEESNGKYIIHLEDKGLRIPFNPQIGTWKVEITWYSNVWIIENICAKITYNFNVGESSLLSNFQAPIYLWIDLVPAMQNDDIIFALPGIIYLSLIILIPATFIFIIWYTKTSIKIGKKVYKIGSGKNVQKKKIK